MKASSGRRYGDPIATPNEHGPDRRGDLPRARAVAFYLPQFHPTEENDDWWGPGFTEWTNTAKARPLFPSHRQPHLPADLGFYDLRLPEVQEAQAALAEAYGIAAFCYWHYWFAGRRILQRPFETIMTSGRPRHSFCLGWANQTWSGIWDGAPDRVLIEQTYPGPDDDRAHFDAILPALRDDRYFRVHGRPLFYVFRPEQLPRPAEFVDRWRSMAEDAGLDGLYLVAEVSDLLGGGPKYRDVVRAGFDAGVYVRFPTVVRGRDTLRMRVQRKLLRWPEHYRYARHPMPPPPDLDGALLHPCVYPNWDNTPRSGRRGMVLTGTEPEAFRVQVRSAVTRLAGRDPEDRLLFVKSWNEWAEGNYLEPDLEHGHGFLRVLQDELCRPPRAVDAPAGGGTGASVGPRGEGSDPRVPSLP